jgi:hypothetical protein
MIIYNLKNREKDDLFTLFDVDEDRSFKMPISDISTVSIEVLWGQFSYDGQTYGTDLDAEDATLELKTSSDGENSQAHAIATKITLDGNRGMSGWQTSAWKDNYLHLELTANSNTTGTIRVIIITKDLL